MYIYIFLNDLFCFPLKQFDFRLFNPVPKSKRKVRRNHYECRWNISDNIQGNSSQCEIKKGESLLNGRRRQISLNIRKRIH